VEAAIGWPTLTSSPFRRCPHFGLSVAMRSTSLRIAAAVDGRPGTLAARVVPLTCDRSPVPGKQRYRGNREHLTPPAAGISRGQRGEPHLVTRLVPDSADLTAQDYVLMPAH
jgi:hypothetical protein